MRTRKARRWRASTRFIATCTSSESCGSGEPSRRSCSSRRTLVANDEAGSFAGRRATLSAARARPPQLLISLRFESRESREQRCSSSVPHRCGREGPSAAHAHARCSRSPSPGRVGTGADCGAFASPFSRRALEQCRPFAVHLGATSTGRHRVVRAWPRLSLDRGPPRGCHGGHQHPRVPAA